MLPQCPLRLHPPLAPQKMSSPARTAASGTAVSGTCKLTSCTTVPVARVPAPLPQPPLTRSPRSHTPTSVSAPSLSAAKAAPVPAPWRSTCAATAVRLHAPPQDPRLPDDSVPTTPRRQMRPCGPPTIPHGLPQLPGHETHLWLSGWSAQGWALAGVLGGLQSPPHPAQVTAPHWALCSRRAPLRVSHLPVGLHHQGQLRAAPQGAHGHTER